MTSSYPNVMRQHRERLALLAREPTFWERLTGNTRKAERARYAEAIAAGVPFVDEDYWPAGEIWRGRDALRQPVIDDKMNITPELFSAKRGDVVPVFDVAGHRYFYEVLAFSRAAGDDHIVSPEQFWIEYHHREPKP